MKKSLKIALVSTLTLAMAFSATVGFAATAKKTVKKSVKAAVVYPVLTKTAGTFKVVNGKITKSVAGLKNLKVKTGALSTAYYNLPNLVPVNTVVSALGGTVTVSSTNLATFKYDGTTSTLQLKAAKGGNAYKISGVWYVSAPAVAGKLVNSVTEEKVAFSATALTFTRSNVSSVANVWRQSVHNSDNWSEEVIAESTKTGCAKCHNGTIFSVYDNLVVSGEGFEVVTAEPGFVVTGEKLIISGAVVEDYNYSCGVCHYSPRGGAALYGGKTPKLSSGMVVKGAGAGAVCMTCHEGRNKVPNYNGTSVATAPHHSVQTDLLFGTINNTVGYKYAGLSQVGSYHGSTPDACVGCHMSNKIDGNANHSMQVNGAVACGLCHNGLKSVDRLAFGDYDGNKSIEPYQDEVKGLLLDVRKAIADKVIAEQALVSGSTITTASTISFESAGGQIKFYDVALDDPAKADAAHNITFKLSNDLTVAKKIYTAAYNVLNIEYDGSYGLHNPAFTIKLLQAAYRDVTGGNDVPNAALK